MWTAQKDFIIESIGTLDISLRDPTLFYPILRAESKESFSELYAALTPEEYAAARASTLNAHYTSPTVIRAIYDAVENMGFQAGNILEPSMGVGNFFGMLPDSMASSKLYGVELDSLTGRIAKQLYPKADITVAGFETTDRKAFLRKMALDGLVIRLDLPELKQMISLLRYTSNNINQIAKRLNESGRAYEIDFANIQEKQTRLWGLANEILMKLSAIQ